MTTKLLTIIVCTRNRASILAECLHSLSKQSASMSDFDVLVVDNASTDGTKTVVEQYTNVHDNFHYAFQGKVGLSRARNTGWSSTDTAWVGYLDDDAKAPEDFVKHALHLIANYDFDCFGGTYYAWYKYGRPKWLPADFGNKEILLPDIGILPSSEHLSGGILFCKRGWLEELGGFNNELGMTDKIGYGEEDDLQQRLRAAGGTIGYDPDFYIEHCVLPHKLKLGWHLRSAYRSGYDSFTDVRFSSFARNLYWLLRTCIGGVLRLPGRVIKVIVIGSYGWKSMVYDTIMMPLNYLGKIIKSVLNYLKVI